jgi:heterodisulfide reductase subunit A2
LNCKRIGVFVCHCGRNIAASVDVQKVVEAMQGYRGVVHAEHYMYMCSDPGQRLVRNAIKEHKLDGIVMSNCSPSLHEETFRNLARVEGINRYRCEIANIREQCSWPHAGDVQAATRKAIAIVKTTVEKLRQNTSLLPATVPVTRRALIIGAGIAGMQSALDIADGGHEVVLVEKASAIGGHVAQLSRTFPHLEPASALLAPLVARVQSHPRITVLTASELESVSGFVGSFEIDIRVPCDSGQTGPLRHERVGAIIVATGYDMFSRHRIAEYEPDPDVVDGLQFERLLAQAGEAGQVRRPSDGRPPREIVFVQCAGSRDPEHGVPYCSRVCCMYTAKQAALYMKAIPDGQAYVFYMDTRTDAKGYEEFARQVSDGGVLYLRGRVSRIFRDGDRLKIWGTDTLSGKQIEISADMAVLATAMTGSTGARDLGKKVNVITDVHGFFTEAHAKLRPVETLTGGVYLAGTAQWPKDIPDTIASASAAASKALALFSSPELSRDPTVASVDTEVCSGCAQCVQVCPFHAIEIDARKRVAEVNEALCEGCGACAATCPSKAMKHKNSTPAQFFDMLEAATAGSGVST